MDSPTDNQLALSVLKKLNRLSIYLALAMLFLFLMGSEEGLFGLKASVSLQSYLSFDVSDPFRSLGITVFSSFFIHSGLQHFLSNVFWLVLIGLYIENSRGKSPLAFLLTSGHLLGLLVSFLILKGQVKSTDDLRLVLGSSAGILAIIGYASVLMRRSIGYTLGFVVVMVIVSPVFGASRPFIQILDHFLPFAWGLGLGFLARKSAKGEPPASGIAPRKS